MSDQDNNTGADGGSNDDDRHFSTPDDVLRSEDGLPLCSQGNSGNEGSAPGLAEEQDMEPHPPSMLRTLLGAIQEGTVYVEEAGQAVVSEIGEVGEEFKANVVDETDSVFEAAVDEMVSHDDGDSFFLEMTLARSLSILPEDVMSIADTDLSTVIPPTEVGEGEGGHDESLGEVSVPTLAGEDESYIRDFEGGVKNEFTPLIGSAETEKEEAEAKLRSPSKSIAAYILLASAVVSLSSIGPLLDMQQNCTPVMKIFWIVGNGFVAIPVGVPSSTEGWCAAPNKSTARDAMFMCNMLCHDEHWICTGT